MTAIDPPALELPRLFTPAQAAEILRGLGLTEMTECALRTRAYRRQVPFHLNGRRIRFTAADLREIVEGQPHRPWPAGEPHPLPPARSPAHRPSSAHHRERPQPTWRARTPRTAPSADVTRR
jgi:hypothetical protein